MPLRKTWDRKFLDEVIKKYLSDFDPVSRFIEYQLRSIMGILDIKVTTGTFTENTNYSAHEDSLISAIDRKYKWADTPEGVMWALYVTGHSFKEIAEIFKCSISLVYTKVMEHQKKL